MKRKKWSELEEQTLLSKYSDLLRSGTLAKLKTREKKFKPIADHVNALHHLRDPSSFPFKWSWRDVSIKVQNMRHQYLGVKQKIRLSPHHFNWKDGPNHWENFLKYKEVFGDVQLLETPKPNANNAKLGFEIGSDEDDEDDDEEDDPDEDCDGEEAPKVKRIVAGVLQLREAVVKREERRREREFRRERVEAERERKKKKEVEVRREKRREWLEERELELEERQLRWAKMELEKRVRLEHELEAERRWRKRVEERMEEEEMEWRQRMVELQVEHEKQMMQMHAEACQNQMQILGIMTRLFCQFFGSGNDGLGSSLGALPTQVLHHAGRLGDVKPDANSPSEFL